MKMHESGFATKQTFRWFLLDSHLFSHKTAELTLTLILDTSNLPLAHAHSLAPHSLSHYTLTHVFSKKLQKMLSG